MYVAKANQTKKSEQLSSQIDRGHPIDWHRWREGERRLRERELLQIADDGCPNFGDND